MRDFAKLRPYEPTFWDRLAQFVSKLLRRANR